MLEWIERWTRESKSMKEFALPSKVKEGSESRLVKKKEEKQDVRQALEVVENIQKPAQARILRKPRRDRRREEV